MTRPTPRCLALASAGFFLAVLPAAVDARLWPAWLAFTAAVLLLTGFDAILAPRAADLAAEVRGPGRLYIGNEGTADLSISFRGSERELAAEAILDLDEDLAPQPAAALTVPRGGTGTAAFALRPRRRGTHKLRALWVRWQGPLGLARRQHRRELDLEVAVLPNLGTVRASAVRFFGSRESRSGMKVEHFLGDGSEFESLREFVPGFDQRALSWKATARHRRLLVRQYRAERDHQIVVALDTGRLMSEPLEGIPRIDHAVTSALLLAYCGVRTGDRVGLFAFDSQARRFVPPSGGMAAFGRMQDASAELEYSTEETNYTVAIADMLARLQRRSLVVVFTDFADSVQAELMVENFGRAARRHLLLFVALKDPGIEAIARAEPSDLDALHRAVVAEGMVRDRALVLRRLQRAGVHCLDAAPGRAPAALVNRYLDIKRRELV